MWRPETKGEQKAREQRNVKVDDSKGNSTTYDQARDTLQANGDGGFVSFIEGCGLITSYILCCCGCGTNYGEWEGCCPEQ